VGFRNPGNFRNPGMGVPTIGYGEIITITHILAN
jgi:hypothetical protein